MVAGASQAVGVTVGVAATEVGKAGEQGQAAGGTVGVAATEEAGARPLGKVAVVMAAAAAMAAAAVMAVAAVMALPAQVLARTPVCHMRNNCPLGCCIPRQTPTLSQQALCHPHNIPQSHNPSSHIRSRYQSPGCRHRVAVEKAGLCSRKVGRAGAMALVWWWRQTWVLRWALRWALRWVR